MSSGGTNKAPQDAAPLQAVLCMHVMSTSVGGELERAVELKLGCVQKRREMRDRTRRSARMCGEKGACGEGACESMTRQARTKVATWRCDTRRATQKRRRMMKARCDTGDA